MTPAQAFTLALMQSGVDRDTRVYDLTEAEIDALLRPVIEAEREACAAIADDHYNEIGRSAEHHRREGNPGSLDRCQARMRSASQIAAEIRSRP